MVIYLFISPIGHWINRFEYVFVKDTNHKTVSNLKKSVPQLHSK